jgi:hypothetical protein
VRDSKKTYDSSQKLKMSRTNCSGESQAIEKLLFLYYVRVNVTQSNEKLKKTKIHV